MRALTADQLRQLAQLSRMGEVVKYLEQCREDAIQGMASATDLHYLGQMQKQFEMTTFLLNPPNRGTRT